MSLIITVTTGLTEYINNFFAWLFARIYKFEDEIIEVFYELKDKTTKFIPIIDLGVNVSILEFLFFYFLFTREYVKWYDILMFVVFYIVLF